MPNRLLFLIPLAVAATVTGQRDARACGGYFGSTETPSVVTDHRMILTVSPQQTTLYDQIHYQGSPSSFAWVLPINGQASVGLSSDALFTVLDRVSQTQIIAPPPSCPSPPLNCYYDTGDADGGAAGGSADGGVTVTHHQVVGPYDTVQLHSTDPNALNAWLTSNGYAIPSDVQPIIAAYVSAHFDFLAMKLVPGAGVTAMRPVRVTTAGASTVLPLRMVMAGAGGTVGVTLWVVADGLYEPQNFPWFRINDSELSWDWTTQRSNYTELRASNEAASGGKAWELESSTTQYPQQIQSLVKQASSIYQPSSSSPEYPPIPADDAGNPGKTSQQQYDEDMAMLFAGVGALGSFRLTRLRSDLAKAALANDLVLQASSDQSSLPNIRRPFGQTGTPQCPPLACDAGAPWTADAGSDAATSGGMSSGGASPGGNIAGGTAGGGSSSGCSIEPASSSSLLSIAGVTVASLFAFAIARRRRGTQDDKA